jgi:hypothetical protein
VRRDKSWAPKHPARFVGVSLALLIVMATPVAAAPKPQAPSPNVVSEGSPTAFTGTIAKATGRYRSDHGRLRIDLSDARTTGSVRPATFVLTPLPCRVRRGCLKLGGRLTGTLAAVPYPHPIADVPGKFAADAAGKLKPIGQVRGTGLVVGTGFVASGHETLQLRLSTPKGQITIDASSKAVPGFTTP